MTTLLLLGKVETTTFIQDAERKEQKKLFWLVENVDNKFVTQARQLEDWT